MVSVLGIAILAVAAFWFMGGVFLRVGGVFFFLLGVIGLIALGDAFGIFIALIGAASWLAGHWHFALRHHEYKSPLAERIFMQVLPPRYDPTRQWAVPVVPPPTEAEPSQIDGEAADSESDSQSAGESADV
jgi:hypothetical protein